MNRVSNVLIRLVTGVIVIAFLDCFRHICRR